MTRSFNQLVVMLASEVRREAAQNRVASRSDASPSVLGSGSDDGGGRRAIVLAAHVGDLYNLNISERRSVMWWDVLLRKLWVVQCCSLCDDVGAGVVYLGETRSCPAALVAARLQRHRDVPLQQLLMRGLIMSFIPIIVGVLMFLFEFFDDQMLAFAVFALVWAAEISACCMSAGAVGCDAQVRAALLLAFVLFSSTCFPSRLASPTWRLPAATSSAAAMLYFTNHVLPHRSSTPGDPATRLCRHRAGVCVGPAD